MTNYINYQLENGLKLRAEPTEYDGKVYRVGGQREKDGKIYIGYDEEDYARWVTPEEYETYVKPVLEPIEKELKKQKIKEGEGVDNRRVVLSSLGGAGGSIIGLGGGPILSAAGGILGATIGAQVDRVLDAWEKYQKAKAEGKEVEEPNWIKSLYEIGKDLATEAQYEAVGLLLPPALRTAWNALKWVGTTAGSVAHRVAPGFAENVGKAAESIGELVAKPKVLRSYIPKIERGIESIIEKAKKNPDTAAETVVNILTPERLERLEPTMLRDMASQVDIPPGATRSRKMQRLEQEEYALGGDRAERVAKEYKKALSQLDEAAKPTTAKLADELVAVEKGETPSIHEILDRQIIIELEPSLTSDKAVQDLQDAIRLVKPKYALSAKGEGSKEVLDRLNGLNLEDPVKAYEELNKLYDELLVTDPKQAAILRPHIEEVDTVVDTFRKTELYSPDDTIRPGYDDISYIRDGKRLALMPEKEQVRSPELARIIAYTPNVDSSVGSIGDIVYRDLFGKVDDPQKVMRIFNKLPPAIQYKLIDEGTLAKMLRYATVRKYLNAGLERLSKEKTQDGISSIVKRGIGKILADAASIGGINVMDFVSQLNSYMSNGVIKPQLYNWARRYANNLPGHTGGAMETGYNFAVGLTGLAREILQRAYIRSIGEEGRFNREIESEMFGVSQPNPFTVYPPKSLSELVEAAKNNYAAPVSGVTDLYYAWKPQAFVKDDQNQNNPNDNSTKTQKGPKNK